LDFYPTDNSRCFGNKTEGLRHAKPFPPVIKTVGDLLMVRRKEAGLRANSSWKQRELPSARDFAASGAAGGNGGIPGAA